MNRKTEIKHLKIPFLANIFFPMTPIFFFMIFYFHLIDFLPHETFDWLNVFFDRESVSFYFSPLFVYFYFSFIFMISILIFFSETAFVCSQNKIRTNFKHISKAVLNSIAIFLLVYFVEVILSGLMVVCSILFPSILNLLNLSLLEFILKLIKYIHIFLASMILIYVQFVLPIYLRINKLGLSFKIFLRRIKQSLFYLINIILFVVFIYSSIELFAVILNSNLKYFINNSEIFLYYKSQIASMNTISDVFLSFGYLLLIIAISLIIFVPSYNIIYILGRKLIKKSISNN